jgi:hypothetical protein
MRLPVQLAACLTAAALGACDEAPPSPADDAAAARLAPGRTALVSRNSALRIRSGEACGVSANGDQFAITSGDRLVSADTDNLDDVYLVDVAARAVTLLSPGVGGDAECLAFTPDGGHVAFATNAGSSSALLFVTDVLAGTVTQVTPPTLALPDTKGWIFGGMSDDGSRVAFVGEPTGTYLGPYAQPASSDPAVFVRDLASGDVFNLTAEVVLRTNALSDVIGRVKLSPDGTALAFTSDVDDPGAGDANPDKADVFLLDLQTMGTRLVSADAAGGQTGFQGIFDPMLYPVAFLDGGDRVAFFVPNDSAFGPAGTYAKSLIDGSLELLLEDDIDIRRDADGPRLSFSDNGAFVAYLLRVNGTNLPVAQFLPTGQTVQLADDTSLNVLLNTRANTVVFDTNDATIVPIPPGDAQASSSSVRVYARRR